MVNAQDIRIAPIFTTLVNEAHFRRNANVLSLQGKVVPNQKGKVKEGVPREIQAKDAAKARTEAPAKEAERTAAGAVMDHVPVAEVPVLHLGGRHRKEADTVKGVAGAVEAVADHLANDSNKEF